MVLSPIKGFSFIQPAPQVYGDEFYIQAQTEGGSELTLTMTWDGVTAVEPSKDNK